MPRRTSATRCRATTPRPLQPSQIVQFDGNDDIAYELGAKLDLFDRRLRLNLAAFYTDFENSPDRDRRRRSVARRQRQSRWPATSTLDAAARRTAGIDPLQRRAAAEYRRASASGRTYLHQQPGGQCAASRPSTRSTRSKACSINGSVGWSKLKSPDISARAVNRRQNNPFWTANAGMQYNFPIAVLHGAVTPRIDWTYQSRAR